MPDVESAATPGAATELARMSDRRTTVQFRLARRIQSYLMG